MTQSKSIYQVRVPIIKVREFVIASSNTQALAYCKLVMRWPDKMPVVCNKVEGDQLKFVQKHTKLHTACIQGGKE